MVIGYTNAPVGTHVCVNVQYVAADRQLAGSSHHYHLVQSQLMRLINQ